MAATTTAPVLYLEVGSVARRCLVTPSAVHNWLREGRITPAARTEGGIFLFTPEEVEAIQRAREERQAARVAGRAPRAA
jgi:DNA-binding transcriptional MerR regulator